MTAKSRVVIRRRDSEGGSQTRPTLDSTVDLAPRIDTYDLTKKGGCDASPIQLSAISCFGVFVHEHRIRMPAYAVKLLPHPQPPVELGLLKVKPLPCMEVT